MTGFESNALEDGERHYRIVLALVAMLVGCVFIGILSVALPVPANDGTGSSGGDIYASALLLGRGTSLPYPLTVQNIMWIMFFFALGEVWVRFYRASREVEQLADNPLPAHDATVLFGQGKALAPIYQWATGDRHGKSYILQRLVVRVVQQFQISGSVDQASQLLNSSLELMQHELELKYNMLRYLVWLIPTLGFIGTVIGIALALAEAANMPDLSAGSDIRAWFSGMTVELGIAFNTTLLALIMAALLVFLMHISQGREEAALNRAGQYCLDHLVNRLLPA